MKKYPAQASYEWLDAGKHYVYVPLEDGRKDRLPATLSLQAYLACEQIVDDSLDITKLFTNNTATFAAIASVCRFLAYKGTTDCPDFLSRLFEFLLSRQDHSASPSSYDYGMLLLIAWNEVLHSDQFNKIILGLRAGTLKDTKFLNADLILKIDAAISQRICSESNKHAAFPLFLQNFPLIIATLQHRSQSPHFFSWYQLINQEKLNKKLLRAASENNVAQMDDCLRKGASLDAYNHNRSTPLHLACKNVSSSTVSSVHYLLNRGANVDSVNKNDKKPANKSTWGSLLIAEFCEQNVTPSPGTRPKHK